jgi:4-hydroxy-tetrahydrodipicolinate synthase
MITPFNNDGQVNFAEAARLAEFLVDVQHNDGLVVCGTTGESPTLSESDKVKLLKTVIGAVGDRAAVVFGAGTYNTEETIRLTREGEKAGAHGIMLVNPYYSRPGQAGLYAHFKAVAEETGLPVMLYNIQSRAAINLETPTLLRLAEQRNIVAVKEASGNLAQISDVCASAPKGFRIYSGDDALTLPILSVGGHGVVSVTGHVVGLQIKKMITSFLEGGIKGGGEATALHQQLIPITKATFSSPNPVPIKFATSLLGFDCSRVRLPLVQLNEFEEAPILEAFSEFYPNVAWVDSLAHA